MGRLVSSLALLAIGAALLWGWYSHLEPRRRARHLQEELRAQRVTAESCQLELSMEEAEFDDFNQRVDSLRVRVEGYEALHPEGVPADSFPVYLEAFDEYNEVVEGWEGRARSLRSGWRECSELVEVHNELADSLRGVLREIGAIGGEDDPGAPGAIQHMEGEEG